MNKMINNDFILRKNKILNDSNINNKTNTPKVSKSGQNFDEILSKIRDKEEVKFSKHAVDRLRSRNINLTSEDMKKLNEAVGNARSKGIKDALILLKDNAFIANTKSMTIVTATDTNTLTENIFTNIDGAVIV